jgi:hypothetical protein
MVGRLGWAQLRLALAAVGLSACEATVTEWKMEPGKCGIIFDPHDCVELAVRSDWPVILKGTTMRVYTTSDFGHAAPVTWSVSGAAELVEGSEREIPAVASSAARSILVRGLSTGMTTVTATHGSARTASLEMLVADSSIITRVWIYSWPIPASGSPATATSTVRVGDSIWVHPIFSDGAGREYSVLPDSWTTSDSTVATLTTQPWAAGPGTRTWAVARAIGTSTIGVSFLAVQGTMRITVIPR